MAAQQAGDSVSKEVDSARAPVTVKDLQLILQTIWPPGSSLKPKVVPMHGIPGVGAFLGGQTPRDPCNEVYPGILLGNGQLAQDREKLKSLGVTHVLNSANGPKFNQINTNAEFYSEVGISFLGVPAVDFPRYNLAQHFPAAADFIEAALTDSGRVYVHCQQGISRSCSLILAFLMLKRRLHLPDALKQIREKREVCPNEGFLKQLITLYDSLVAKGDIA